MMKARRHAIGSWQQEWAWSNSRHLIGQPHFDPKSDWSRLSLTVGVSLCCGGNPVECIQLMTCTGRYVGHTTLDFGPAELAAIVVERVWINGWKTKHKLLCKRTYRTCLFPN